MSGQPLRTHPDHHGGTASGSWGLVGWLAVTDGVASRGEGVWQWLLGSP